MEIIKSRDKWILLFEHDNSCCIDIHNLLEGRGYRVHRAKALMNKKILDYVPFRNVVLRVLAIPNKNLPDLVIVDTDTSNTKDLKKIKKHCKKNKLPIIYITSEINDTIINEREKNAIGIFKKPIHAKTIVELITEYFKNKIILESGKK